MSAATKPAAGRWLEGRVLENRRWTDALFSLRVEAPRLRFEAGQFVRIALDVEGERVARPFSFVNGPQDAVLEFYGVIVPEGPLSPRLARLAAGEALYIAPNPSGFLVLSELPDADTLWLMSTGTGIAPFLSILAGDTVWARYSHVVLVHAVRRAEELTYREHLDVLRARMGERLRVVSMVSREAAPGTLAGRIPAAITDGRLAAAAGRSLSVDGSQVMLCGNPDMVRDATDALKGLGMRKHRRRSPGQITVENFW
ncbi:MAG: ferredoxin-NADP reductase [Betaproteobacteria bacterium SG8_39]|nr:MAG: ferredoxin-NADP reductase [Betaproteobacteria bacterium SG8_39]